MREGDKRLFFLGAPDGATKSLKPLVLSFPLFLGDTKQLLITDEYYNIVTSWDLRACQSLSSIASEHIHRGV